jgi:uncharacterized glyoxalase superfamily protein PhnB
VGRGRLFEDERFPASMTDYPLPKSQVNLHVPDPGASYDYLTNVLGFAGEFRVKDPKGGYVFAGVRWGPNNENRIILGGIEEALHGHYDHAEFGEQMTKHPLGTGVVFYSYVKDVDKKHAEILARGAKIDEPPTDQFWGERTISVITNDGFYFTFAQEIKGFKFPPGFEERIEVTGPRKKTKGQALRKAAKKRK